MEDSHTIQLLLVEDNPVAARAARAVLEQIGPIQIDMAVSLAEAMQLISRGFDIILLDLFLPDSEGLDSFLKLRQGCPHTPIVILSGLDDRSVALRAVQAGAQDFLVKGELNAELLEKSIRHSIERNGIEMALKESEERYALAARGSNDGIWDWDVQHERLYFSPRFLAMIGKEEDPPGDLQQWADVLHPDDKPGFLQLMEQHMAGDLRQFRVEYRVQHPEGQYRWMLVRGESVRDESGKIRRMAGSQTDITDFRLIDTLTGLPNRLLFADRLEQAYLRFKNNHSKGFALIYLDIVRFARLNESFGIQAADTLLGNMAARLTDALELGDTISRPGSDEFLILIDNVASADDMKSVESRLKESLQKPFYCCGEEIYLDFSAGVALSELREEGPESLIQDAHSALQRSKQKGGSVFEIYRRELSEASRERMQLELMLRKALETGQFCLFYQPQMDLRSGKINGFEALIRWRHPELGLITPDRFLPVAEETGLIQNLGEWTIREAIHQLNAWHQMGRTARIAVNLSPSQFRSRQVAAFLRKELEQASFDPGLLEMEFTETVALENAEHTIAELNEIRAMGLRIAVDDFGTGFSSLTYLKRFPVDAVKIDRDFVMNIPGNKDDGAIVAAILAMGKSLGLEVVAEGVETESQLRFLQERNCEYVQGYLISRPVPAEEAIQFLD
ncbi:MAG: EAL domain-containing protein [Leptospiraceae bacterium]|nr:EAL domain-containing protein [Leptospiraceae bacterium]